MKIKKSIWTTITGGLASFTPILFSVCKGGACVGVCVSPVASLFGISSATIAASPIVSAIEPLLIAISAVSFTISYYSLYVLPKFNCNTDGSCDCAPTDKEKRKTKITKAIFCLGLILSIGFLSYFEYQKYQVNTQAECSTSECASGECSTDNEESYTPSCDSTSSCCSSDGIEAKNTSTDFSCKLTSPELQKRKATVLAKLKEQILERKELPNGYAFKFKGDDETINWLYDFIKSERACCNFFTFNLSISGDKSEAWLQITGAKEAKGFITTEMGLTEKSN